MSDLNKKPASFRYLPQMFIMIFAAGLLIFAFSPFIFKDGIQITLSTNQIDESFHVETEEQKSLPLNTLLTKERTLIVFWATWCDPCVEELNSMPNLLPQIEHKGIGVVFVNYDGAENLDQARAFLGKLGLQSYYDLQGDVLSKLGVSALPMSILVDKSGKILKTIVGAVELAQL